MNVNVDFTKKVEVNNTDIDSGFPIGFRFYGIEKPVDSKEFQEGLVINTPSYFTVCAVKPLASARGSTSTYRPIDISIIYKDWSECNRLLASIDKQKTEINSAKSRKERYSLGCDFEFSILKQLDETSRKVIEHRDELNSIMGLFDGSDTIRLVDILRLLDSNCDVIIANYDKVYYACTASKLLSSFSYIKLSVVIYNLYNTTLSDEDVLVIDLGHNMFSHFAIGDLDTVLGN